MFFSFNSSCALLMHSSLSMTIRHVPLSPVRITLLVSFLSSFNAFCSSFVMLDLGGWIFFRTALTSALNSSASPWAKFWHVCSTAAIYSPMGGHLGVIAKFVPWVNSFSWASMSGILDIFTTHLFLRLLVDLGAVEVPTVDLEFSSAFDVLAVELKFLVLLCLLACLLFMQPPSLSSFSCLIFPVYSFALPWSCNAYLLWS